MTDVGNLVDAYDLFIFDLDGVVVLGHEPVGGAVDTVNGLIGSGSKVAYATNNASRRADEVADLLVSLGITARPGEVVTSAQASARLLATRLGAGARVLVVGGPALRAEVADAGLTPVTSADDNPQAVVQGYAAAVGWADLAEACVAVRAGAIWIATNADRTLPSPRGALPGNGSLVAALATALDRQPDVVVGKPAPELFQSAAAQAGAVKPLVVGDRLDTDIAGAVRARMDSMLVLTGVSTPEDLLAAPPDHRPVWVSGDLRGLGGGAARVPIVGADVAEVATGGWRARRDGDDLELDGSGSVAAALAVLAGLAWSGSAWSGAARGGSMPNGSTRSAADRPITAASGEAAQALRELGLDG